MDKQEKALSILLDEYKRASSNIVTLISDSEKIFGIWVTLITLAFGVGLREDYKGIFLLLPLAIVAVFYYLINIYERVMSTGGYAATIEKEVNEIVGQNVLRWESYLSRDLHQFKLTTVLLIVICLGVSVGIMVFSINRNLASYPKIGKLQAGLITVFLLIGIWHVLKLSSLHTLAERKSVKLSSFVISSPTSDSADTPNEKS